VLVIIELNRTVRGNNFTRHYYIAVSNYTINFSYNLFHIYIAICEFRDTITGRKILKFILHFRQNH